MSEPAMSPDVPTDVLPGVPAVEFDWFHQFPCRYGNAIPGQRDFAFQGRPVIGTPFAWDDGACWCSARHLAAYGPPSDILMTEQTMFSRMGYRRNGVVESPTIWLIPLEGLADAIRAAEDLLAADVDSEGIKEWAPAFGTGPSGEHVGLHLRFYKGWDDDDAVRQRRFAEEVGAYGVVAYGHDHTVPYDVVTGDRVDVDFCTLRDLDGTVWAHSLDGRVYSVDSAGLFEQLPDLQSEIELGHPHWSWRR